MQTTLQRVAGLAISPAWRTTSEGTWAAGTCAGHSLNASRRAFPRFAIWPLTLKSTGSQATHVQLSAIISSSATDCALIVCASATTIMYEFCSHGHIVNAGFGRALRQVTLQGNSASGSIPSTCQLLYAACQLVSWLAEGPASSPESNVLTVMR